MTTPITAHTSHECRVRLSPTLSIYACRRSDGWAAHVIHDSPAVMSYGALATASGHPDADTAIAAVLREARKLASDMLLAIDSYEVRT